MSGQRKMLSRVTAATLAATLLAGVGPAAAEEPAPITGIEAVEAATAAEDATNVWAEDAQAPMTAETQAADGLPYFSDARNGEHSTAIMWARRAGITTGWVVDGRTYYRPALPVTRDAMAAFLYRLAGSPDYTPPAASPFKDVSVHQQFYKEIAWLADRGITTGWPDGTFRPSAPVNRDATAAFLYRMAGTPYYQPPADSPFDDVAPDQEHYREIAWLAERGVTTGWPDGTFRALQPVARDAMAAFLYRYATPGWRPPVISTFDQVPTVRNDGFTVRRADVDGINHGPSAVREFSAPEQAVLDFDNTGHYYEKIETVFGVEDGGQDPEAVYRVLVYFKDRVRREYDVRPGRPVVYDDTVMLQDHVRIEVTKVAGTGTSTFVMGGSRLIAEIDPNPQPVRRGPPARYYLSHFEEVEAGGFTARPETITGIHYQSSLSSQTVDERPRRIRYAHVPLGLGATFGVADRSVDPGAQYRVRVLAEGVEKASFVVTADTPYNMFNVSGDELEVTRITGEGDSVFVIGNGHVYGTLPFQAAP